MHTYARGHTRVHTHTTGEPLFGVHSKFPPCRGGNLTRGQEHNGQDTACTGGGCQPHHQPWARHPGELTSSELQEGNRSGRRPSFISKPRPEDWDTVCIQEEIKQREETTGASRTISQMCIVS